MKKNIIYNPSISTTNIGDEIIFESVYSQIRPVLENSFNVNVSTHLPISYVYSRLLEKADNKFVCGTNLLRNRLDGVFRQWDINCFNAKKLGPCILVGVGWQQDGKQLSKYTKGLYKKILHREKLHSVRDEYTKEMLKKIGFDNVINTSCATMWSLTPEKCKKITEKKAKKVVFTLTDYNKDIEKDKMIIEALNSQYSEVYLWLQGYNDFEYAKSLGVLDRVSIVNPNLNDYDNLLMGDENVEYIGTRLHGGIRALQKERRTMIIAVDGRAEEKKKDFNLPVISRSCLTKEILNSVINEDRKTDIRIPLEDILLWKKSMGLI